MSRRLSRILALLVSCALVVGCAAPAGTQTSAQMDAQASEHVKAAGTPWKDYFIAGTLSNGDNIRMQDDFYTGVLRDWLVEQNESGETNNSTTVQRENQINDQMLGLIEDSSKTGGNNAQDLENLRDLYGLYEDWDGRDADGLSPLIPLVKRLQAVKSTDELTQWLCSDDYRLAGCWRPNEEGVTDGVALFGLTAYTDLDDEGAPKDGYVLEVVPPNLNLLSFNMDASELNQEEALEYYRAASANVELAWWMLELLGYSEEDASNVIVNAVALEQLIDDDLTNSSENYAEYTPEQWESLNGKDLPFNRIAQAYGYGDASSYAAYDTSWLESFKRLYTSKNLELFKSHALVGLLINSASILDTNAYDAMLYADGSTFMPEEYMAQVASSSEETSAELSAQEQELYNIEAGRAAMDTLNDALPTCFAKVYVNNFYDESLNERAKDLVERIVDQYEEMLAGETWLSKKTRDAAIDKLNAIHIQVGYPEVWADTSSVSVRSRKEGGTLFSEIRRLRDLEMEQEQRMLRNPSEGTYWNDCMDVNAYYIPTTNSIAIGAGYLGGPYWPEGATDEQILAGTGTMVGHEISHAFDSAGAQFDKSGKYKNWWTDEDRKAFDERVKKVQQCFSVIDPLGEGPYDGTVVCDEAISDLGGMKVTLQLASKNANFNYDAFFKAYARAWSCITTLDVARELLAADSHPLDRDRVNVPLREFDKFFETYGIKEGDAMWLSPEDRISVW